MKLKIFFIVFNDHIIYMLLYIIIKENIFTDKHKF